jgi:hypothetical protein
MTQDQRSVIHPIGACVKDLKEVETPGGFHEGLVSARILSQSHQGRIMLIPMVAGLGACAASVEASVCAVSRFGGANGGCGGSRWKIDCEIRGCFGDEDPFRRSLQNHRSVIGSSRRGSLSLNGCARRICSLSSARHRLATVACQGEPSRVLTRRGPFRTAEELVCPTHEALRLIPARVPYNAD